ncbi:hypothetical protein Q2T94_15190 [Paeniglutamicibacter sulfureus]|uniref:hypothetical protein n=1 Tax=Paeniglutamicibacter sulfureus TaxID=43666 RepID=UPI0026655FBB|nr:hypothetical protein [Paeniglutamicibacter sulfureus]MDO2935652.1 hypothetical protein [Paeniglutamicibacter sulfureus]
MTIIPAIGMIPGGPEEPASILGTPGSADVLTMPTMESGPALLTFHGNELLEIDFKPRTELTVPMVLELLEDIGKAERRVRYLLVDICGLDSIDPEVSCIFNSTTKGVRSVFQGSGPADRVLARFFMRKIDTSRRFTYVENRQDALAFLLNHE